MGRPDVRQHTVDEWEQRKAPFQFSNSYKNHNELDEWMKWLEKRGVKAALVQEKRIGGSTFSIWIKHKGAKFDMGKGTRYMVKWEVNGFTGDGEGREKA